MPANLENSAVATGLEKVSFNSNPKERKCQRIFTFSSVAQFCQTLCEPVDCSTLGFPVHHQLPEPTQTHVHCVSLPSNHLILWHPLLLPPSIFPGIRVFSNVSALCIRCPKYWSFSFSISTSNEYSGLIPFTMNWLDSSQSNRLSRVFSNTTV